MQDCFCGGGVGLTDVTSYYSVFGDSQVLCLYNFIGHLIAAKWFALDPPPPA